ncbi:MAG TPA: hypothetical protein VGJ81_05435 [Thermoanaerobaculia bacterium]|jgi:hypothetical protein
MIKTLLDKIGTLLEAEFLFGSFLPSLVFAMALVVTGTWVIGAEATLSWVAQRTPLDRTMFSFGAAVAVVVFAYVLSGARPLLIRIWSGEADVLLLRPFQNVLRALQRRNFVTRRSEAKAENRWNGLSAWLRTEALQLWGNGAATAPKAEIAAALNAIRHLHPAQSVEAVKTVVTNEFLGRLKHYTGKSLEPVYAELLELFNDWVEAEEGRLNTLRWKLTHDFGRQDNIQPTRLGNIIEAYNSYSYTRYGIEPETFWPHLQTQIPERVGKMLSNAGTTMDFALTLATLSVVYFLIAAFAGPWAYATWLWVVPCAVAVLIAAEAYRLATVAAEQFGALFRASFDMFGLNLLIALHRSAPATSSLARAKWLEMSRLVMYADPADFELTVPVTTPEAEA